MFKLLVFLLAGAIINVAVAWGLAVALNPKNVRFDAEIQTIPSGRWVCMLWKRTGACLFSSAWQNLGAAELVQTTPLDPTVVPAWSQARSSLPDNYSTSKANYTFVDITDVRGWPCLSMRSERVIERDPLTTINALRFGIELTWLPWSNKMARTLPLRPIWPGFAINTIIYAAIFYALFAVPAVRRRVRIRRGQCAVCGYSLRDIASEKCPECGANSPQRGAGM